jgi:N-methylhydantoinase A/oxoprolinase/acetone carboxylase beta subunit
LTTQLNAVQRATTVALNAHLILPLRELIASVQQTIGQLDIAAPLMVVKGDGSLVCADWALQRPIETILSGPAASVVGAWHVAGRRDIWVVDVGGTTTDIAALRNGRPSLNPVGARVGGWQTMVEAIDVHTAGLGGDSHVQVNRRGEVLIGPRRAVPLCLLAREHPEILDDMQHYLTERRGVKEGERPPERNGVTEFVQPLRTPSVELSSEDAALLSDIAGGPQSLATLVSRLRNEVYLRQRVDALETRRLIQRAGFTPTDALHVLGRYRVWDAEASRLGAEWLSTLLGISAEAFCENVVRSVSDRITTELVSKVLEDEGEQPHWDTEPSASALLRRALDVPANSELDCRLSLNHPLVAIGAPVEAYMPRVAGQLHTDLVIPPHAEVANAVGAVSGGVVQRVRVVISQQERVPPIRVHLPDCVRDFDDLEEAVRHAQAHVTPLVEAMARLAGADSTQIETRMERCDHQSTTSRGQMVYLGTELVFTAAGRPSFALRQG